MKAKPDDVADIAALRALKRSSNVTDGSDLRAWNALVFSF
jgi:hypothetical protein